MSQYLAAELKLRTKPARNISDELKIMFVPLYFDSFIYGYVNCIEYM